MRLGIIGAGNAGGSLGGLWASKGHEVIFGVRDLDSEKVKSLLRVAVPDRVGGRWMRAEDGRRQIHLAEAIVLYGERRLRCTHTTLCS